MRFNYPLTRYVYRPVSAPLAALLADTAVTPTQVTFFSAGLTLAGGVAFGFGRFVLGALLALAASIIDCVDGDLARATGRTSSSGAFLDSVRALDRLDGGARL